MSAPADQHCGTCYSRPKHHEPDDGHAYAAVFETSGEDSVFCPWCGADNGTDGMDTGVRIDCSECEREFSVEVQFDPVYSTRQMKCFACLSPAEHPLRIKLEGGSGACSEVCQTACDNAYAEYVAAYQASKGAEAVFPSRGFLTKEGAA